MFVDNVAHNVCCQIRADNDSSTCTFTTDSQSQPCITCSTIETKEVARIGYNGFLFPHSYSGDGLGAYGIYFYTFNAFKITINKNKTTDFYRSTSFRFSFIFRYYKVFQVKRIVYI